MDVVVEVAEMGLGMAKCVASILELVERKLVGVTVLEGVGSEVHIFQRFRS